MKIVEAKPAMATLNPATMTIGDHEFRNPPLQMYKLAERMLELGIKAEVEIYDTGHIGLMLDLLKKELLTEPLQVSFVMGVKGGMVRPAQVAAQGVSAMSTRFDWLQVGGISREVAEFTFACAVMFLLPLSMKISEIARTGVPVLFQGSITDSRMDRRMVPGGQVADTG